MTVDELSENIPISFSAVYWDSDLVCVLTCARDSSVLWDPPPDSPINTKRQKAGRKKWIAFRAGIPNHSADTPRELPGLLVNLSSRGPHIIGATLPILWKSVIAAVLVGDRGT